jgi:rhodanese-related sulfurtransferase
MKNLKNMDIRIKFKRIPKNSLKQIFLILLLILNLIGCESNPGSKSTISKNLSVKDAQVMISENQQNTDFVILDLRTPQETRQGIIKGAILLDFMKSDFQSKIEQLDREKTYLLYCQSGYRSEKTQKLLEKKNFKRVYNMFRGFIGWRSNGYPFEYP